MPKTKAKPFTKSTHEVSFGICVTYRVDGDNSLGNAIAVYQRYNDGKVWQTPSINRYTCNGVNGVAVTENLVAALRDAIREAKRLDKRTGTKVKS